MKSSEWTSPAHSGEGEIFSRLWAHEEPRAVLLLVHGMAEHSARYADFGSFLAENGFAVFMNDHAGHGRSAVVQGHFADRDGWEHVLADLHRLEADARAKYPGLPVFIFGHSMGSFLTREYIARWGGGLSAAVICGTMGANPLLGFARALASLQAAVKGPKSPGKLIESLSTGGYHKQFPGEGPSAWLAADKSVIEIPELDPEDDMDSPEPPRHQPEEESGESALPVETDDEDETLADDGLMNDQLNIPGEEDDEDMEDFSVDDLGDMDLDDPLE